MAYQELIKNFEKIRAYMRDFYLYGFKSRTEYNARSARSYDDERRRLESWLGDYMRFTQTADGKNVFLSVDSRVAHQNPFYKAWKARSFTDGDITLHFAIFDILHTADIRKTLTELIDEIDGRLTEHIPFDESTLRKKLKEYAAEGTIQMEKEGRKVFYRRSPDTDISALADVLDFFSEAAPCGVVGSFLLDKLPKHTPLFAFKHHYMTPAMDSDVLAMLFTAMHGHHYITSDYWNRRMGNTMPIRVVPLKIFISAQNGKQNLLAVCEKTGQLYSYRLDYMSAVRIEDTICPSFDALRDTICEAQAHMWGVNCKRNIRKTEQVMFEIRIADDEQFIVQRLEREKRCGRVEQIDENHYRYLAEVFDTTEMLPWIRTFISRITKLEFSNQAAEEKFRADLQQLYQMYGVDGGEADAVQ